MGVECKGGNESCMTYIDFWQKVVMFVYNQRNTGMYWKCAPGEMIFDAKI